ncbi:MAG: hypothetical protein CM15mP104_1820 [Gammaproteobacteria bacterium]|nr:MAG: hypothetical protein CM15mP104_1820 [Gammaproteobacteria bacterium]
MVLKGAKITLSKTKILYFELWDKLTEKFKYSGSEIIGSRYVSIIFLKIF